MQTFAPRGKIHGPILPQFVLETSISFGAKIMYALLCNYASDNDRCWPSQATLAERLSCSVSSVKKYLAELVGIKLVLVRREQYRSSVYYMLQPEKSCASRSVTTQNCTQSISDSTRPTFACPQPKVGYLNTFNKQREIQNPPLPPVRPALPKVAASPRPSVLGGGGVSVSDFEKVWELYPKKEAKGLAYAAWQNLLRQKQLPPLAQIEGCIRHFMATESWQREQGRFVPQMGNWLKGQRWLDAPALAFGPAVGVVAVQEPAKTQQATQAIQAMQQKEDASKAARAKEREALRPSFEVFAEKFQLHANPWLKPMAFGLWMHLHTAHRAPTPADVPKDNHLSIAEFLQAFKRRCEESAWSTASALERAIPPVPEAFSAPHTGKAFSCDEHRLHLPVPSRQPRFLTFAKAI